MNIAYYVCAEIRFVLIATVSAVVTERVHHLSARVERGSCLSSIVETQASQAETARELHYCTLAAICCTVSVMSVSTAAKMKFAMQ